MGSNARLTAVEEQILRLLARGEEMYGLQLVEKSAGKLKAGSVYVYLHDLEKNGLLSSRLEERAPGQNGPLRRVYQITGQGERVLRAWDRLTAACDGTDDLPGLAPGLVPA